MPNILQVAVPTGNAAIIWPNRSDPNVNSLLFINQDLNNTVWIGQESIITAGGQGTIPIPPNGTFSGNANSPWYVIGSVAGTQPLVVVPNGAAYFLGLTQGLGKLAIPSIMSPNFITGLSGWQIAKDGSAEFNNLTLRGTFKGNDFEINNFGFFMYNGAMAKGSMISALAPLAGTDSVGNNFGAGLTLGVWSAVTGNVIQHFAADPNGVISLTNASSATTIFAEADKNLIAIYNAGGRATGNLIASIANSSGNDGAGNTTKDGFTIYNGAAYIQVHVNGTVSAPAIELVTGDTSEAEHAAIYSIVEGSNPSQNIAQLFQGPGSTFDNKQASILLASSAANGATEAVGELIYFNPTERTILFWDNDGLHIISKGTQTWAPTLSQTDISVNPATGTAFQNISNIYPIGANDANQGTAYRLTAGGTFSIGSTVQVLTISPSVFSNNVIALPIGGAEFVINTNYWWRAQFEVVFGAIGASGWYTGSMSVTLGVTSANQATVAGTNQTAGGFAAFGISPTTINTTIAHSIALQAKWGATVGAPSITGEYSTLERLGV